MKLRPLDIAVVLAAAALVVLTASRLSRGAGQPAVVRITARDGEYLYPLSDDRTLRIPGPLGRTTVAIAGGKARITDSPCPNKICVQSGAISRAGAWVACLPNRVFVSIEKTGGAETGSHGKPQIHGLGDVDAVSF